MSKARNYVIGMDMGTTNIKALIMGEDGEIVAEASRPNRFIELDKDKHEQDAEAWWKSAVEIFREITAAAGTDVVDGIKGISISSHTVTLLPIGRDGEPLRNALTYQDGRSAKEMGEILEKIGKERFVSIVGGQPSVAFLPNKILWFRRHEPELFEKTTCFLQASSFVNFKLTGEYSMDLDQASRTQCLDIGTMSWSKEIGDAVGADLDRLLPTPVPVNQVIGAVSAKAAAETGLKKGIPVLAGCSDAMASMYATGMSHLGEAGESSGTTSLVFAGSDRQSVPDAPVVTRPCAIEGMPWIFDAPIQTSGAALKWYIEKMGAEENEKAKAEEKNIFDYLNALAIQSEPGAGGLFFFPYLLGERAPLWNDYARAMFIGIGMNTSRADMIRSVYEGTSYALRHVMETVKISGAKADSLRICGGGARNRLWSRIKSSMLHMPVCLLDERSGDVPVGDAVIAGHAVGLFPDLTEAVTKIIRVKEVIEPDPEWEKVYDELFPFYVRMYQDLDADLKALREVTR